MTTLERLVGTMLPPYPQLDTATRTGVEHDVFRHVHRQVEAMPAFLRLPLRVGLLGFGLLPILRYGRPFRSLSGTHRKTWIELWSHAPVPPMRDLVKLVRSTSLLAYFDHPEVRRSLDTIPDNTGHPS